MLEEKKPSKLVNIITNLQKVFVFAFFFSFILLFIYCLGFFTPYYDIVSNNGDFKFNLAAFRGVDVEAIRQTYCPENPVDPVTCDGLFTLNASQTAAGNISMKYFTKFASQDVQVLNHMLFWFSIIGILISLLLFVYRAQIRKRYYITNYIVTGICSVYSLVTCIFLFIQFNKYEAVLNNVRFDLINAYYTQQKLGEDPGFINKFSKNSISYIYTIGRIILVLMLIAAVGLVVLNICKYIRYKDFGKKVEQPVAELEVNGGVING